MIIFEHISYFEMISVERVKSASINYAVYVVRYKRCVMIGPFKWLFYCVSRDVLRPLRQKLDNLNEK